MYDMHITHIGRSSDAIGARVKTKLQVEVFKQQAKEAKNE